jgi:CrcB protein
MESLVRVAVLSLGGALGVNARYWLGDWVNRWASPQFPWATFTINVSGSFAIGFLTMVLVRWLPHPHMRLLVITGFLGGYTTFSSFAFESVTLWERGERGLSLTYMVGSVVAGFVAVVLGIALARDLVIPSWERSNKGDKPSPPRVIGVSEVDRQRAETGVKKDTDSPDRVLPSHPKPIGPGHSESGEEREKTS